MRIMNFISTIRKNTKYALVIAVSLFYCSYASALVESSTKGLTGSSIAQNQRIRVKDREYLFVQSNKNTWTNKFENKSITNKVRLIAQEDYSYTGDGYKAEVEVKISVWYPNTGSPSVHNLTKTLVVTYDPDKSNPTKDIDEVHLTGNPLLGAAFLKVKVSNVTFTNLDGGGSITSAANLVLLATTEADRYYKIFQGPTGPSSKITTLAAGYKNWDGVGKADEALILWWPKPGVEEYELEWTYVNDYGVDGSTIAASNLSYDFGKNSTRVSTNKFYYYVPLTFERGYLVYRVRPVGRGGTDFEQPIYGEWSSPDNGTVSSANYKYTINNHSGASSDPKEWGHEANKNWQYLANFAEEGKRKVSISYFDGSLRNRQSLTKLNTEDEVLIGQTMYDFQGRPAIEVLPAPAEEKVLKYYEQFNRDASGNEFNKQDFDYDADTNSCAISTTTNMSSSYGASKYYSSNNSDQDRWNAYLPDAGGYPFTQIEYEPDNTGRIRRQSGVGDAHQLENTHETKYLYGKPFQIELDRLFGSEVGYAGHYKKNVVVDANGQASVSYLDQQGRVIATALIGDNPSNLEAMIDENDSVVMNKVTTSMYGGTMTVDLLNKDSEGDVDDTKDDNIRSLDKMSLDFSQKMIVPETNTYAFDYEIKPQTFSDGCMGTDCFDGVYELEVDIVDECGKTVSGFTAISKTIGDNPTEPTSDSLSCGNNPSSWSSELDATYYNPSLSQGSYYVSKKLKLNEESMDWYANKYVELGQASCFDTYNDVLTNEVAKLDFTQCDPVDCSTCKTNLGTQLNYADLDNSGYIDAPREQHMADEWDYLLAECAKLCSYQSTCDLRYEMMLEDVSPGGQYGMYDPSTFVATSYPLSVFDTTGNKLPKDDRVYTWADWHHPTFAYEDLYGIKDSIAVISQVGGGYLPELMPNAVVHNGKTPVEYLKNLQDFVGIWKLSYAKSLVEYHPEYQYYKTCKEYDTHTITVNSNVITSDAYDSAIVYSSFDDMLSLLYATPPSYCSAGMISTFISDLMSNDPYFNYQFDRPLHVRLEDTYDSVNHWLTGQGGLPNIWRNEATWVDGRDSRMSAQMTSNFNSTGHAAQDLAASMSMCTNNTNCSTVVANLNCSTATEYQNWWEYYKNLYLSAKQTIQQEVESRIAVHNNSYNECFGTKNIAPTDLTYMQFGVGLSGSTFQYYDDGTYATSNTSNPWWASNHITHQWNEPYSPCTSCPTAMPDVCSWSYRLYYTSKTPRFPNVKKQLGPISSMNPNSPTAPQIPSSSGQIGYQNYQNTLMCPLMADLMGLMNDVTDKKDLSTSQTFWLNNNTDPNDNITVFDYNFIDALNGTTGVFHTYKWNSSVGGTGYRTLTLDFLESGTNSQCTTTFVFPSSSSYNWQDYTVTDFMNFQFVNESPAGTYNFTGKVQLYLSDYSDAECVEITGSTCLPIGGCSFNDTCVANQMAEDIVNLLNGLSSRGELTTGATSMESNYGYASIFNSNTFGAYLDLTSTIDWNTGSPYYLTDQTNQIQITFAFTVPSTFNVQWIIPNIHSGSSYNAYIYYDDGSNYYLDSAIIQFYDAALGTSNLDIGTCDNPRPASCNTNEHRLREDIEAFLNELVSQGDLTSTTSVDLDNYVSLSNLMKSYSHLYSSLDYIFVNSGSQDQLKIYKGEDACPIYLDEPSGFTWGDITSFYRLRAAKVTNVNGQIFDFTVVATDGSTEEVLSGTSCFPIANCTDCYLGEDYDPLNLDFESYSGAPTGENQFDGYVDNWTKAGGNPDYYVGSSADTACNGTAVAGVLMFDGDNSDTRDYIQVGLNTALTAGHRYEVSLSIRRNDTELGGSYSPIGITEMGAYFTDNLITPSGSGVLSYTPQAMLTNSSGLASTYACSRLSATFVAGGGEDVIVLGNFNADTNTTLYPEVSSTSSLMAYYYIDSVKVTQLDCNQGVLANMPCPDTVAWKDPCDSMLMNIARTNAKLRYEYYVDSIKVDFKKRYMSQMMDNVVEKFEVTFPDKEYHYTLYYYDQAGNLVRTVPPKGVRKIRYTTPLGKVRSYRQDPVTNAADFTATQHTYVTTYKYNTLNQLVKQSTPDHDDVTRFWYDPLGRLVASKNALQDAKSSSGDTVYSYTLYDDLGRIYEVGEVKTNNDNIHNHITNGVLSTTGFNTMISNGTRTQITKTYYDEVLVTTNTWQENLRNRVSTVTFEEKEDTGDDDQVYDFGTHYSYDEHGNVKRIDQEQQQISLGFNWNMTIEYVYDLVSGNVNEVHLDAGTLGEYYHKYMYDADNRITKVYTSNDGYQWDRDALYQYYKHGPLARVTIGDHEVQAQDFVYTLHGWIKGVNSNTLAANTDPGKDGYYGLQNPGRFVGRDVAGYSLHYYDDDGTYTDYQSIASIASGDYFIADQSSGDIVNNTNSKELYNGNIARMVTSIREANSADPDFRDPLPQGSAYLYDQLNRITTMRAYRDNNLVANNYWSAGGNDASYRSSFQYDENGNLYFLNRHGESGATVMDSLEYHYISGTNKLEYVDDNAGSYATADDIEDQSSGNYDYDEIGNMIKDNKENIDTIAWNVYGKVTRVIHDPTTTLSDLIFRYDGNGNRVMKTVIPLDGAGSRKNEIDWTHYIYARDAGGNIMAVYTVTYEAGTAGRINRLLKLKEVNLFGSSRLGMKSLDSLIYEGDFSYTQYDATSKRFSGVSEYSTFALTTDDEQSGRLLGDKKYELPNHLGNVLAVVSDKKLQNSDYTLVVDDHLSDASRFSGSFPQGAPCSTCGNYTEGGTATASYQSGPGNISLQANQNGYIEFSITTPSTATTYHISVNTSVTTGLKICTYDGTTETCTTSVSTTQTEFDFTTTAGVTTHYIRFKNTDASQQTFTIDNISITTPTEPYLADMIQTSDYYPFGQTMPGRQYSGAGGNYRYGMMGKENDDEIKGENNSLDFGARIYDPRVGRWLSVDPLAVKYPNLSPYNFVQNSPVLFIDPDGNKIKIHYEDENGRKHKVKLKNPSDVALLKDIKNNFVQDVYKTLVYLQKAGVQEVNEAISLRKTVHIKEGAELAFHHPTGANNFKKVITFNGTSGLEVVDDDQVGVEMENRRGTGFVQSPALGFLHELGHFIGFAKNKRAYKKRHKTEDPVYHNKEEKRVIEEIENPAAEKLGEFQRSNHSGIPVETGGPTKTEKVKNNPKPKSVRYLGK